MALYDFFGKRNSLFKEVSPNICKNSFSNSSNVFPAKPSLKVYEKSLGKMQNQSRTSQISKMEHYMGIVNNF